MSVYPIAGFGEDYEGALRLYLEERELYEYEPSKWRVQPLGEKIELLERLLKNGAYPKDVEPRIRKLIREYTR